MKGLIVTILLGILWFLVATNKTSKKPKKRKKISDVSTLDHHQINWQSLTIKQAATVKNRFINELRETKGLLEQADAPSEGTKKQELLGKIDQSIWHIEGAYKKVRPGLLAAAVCRAKRLQAEVEQFLVEKEKAQSQPPKTPYTFECLARYRVDNADNQANYSITEKGKIYRYMLPQQILTEILTFPSISPSTKE